MTRVGNLKVVAVAGGGTLFFHAGGARHLPRRVRRADAAVPVIYQETLRALPRAHDRGVRGLRAGPPSRRFSSPGRSGPPGSTAGDLRRAAPRTRGDGPVHDGPRGGGLIAARFVQACPPAIAASSLGAALVDVRPGRAQLVNAIMPLIGMAVGALGTSALVQYAPASAPSRLRDPGGGVRRAGRPPLADARDRGAPHGSAAGPEAPRRGPAAGPDGRWPRSRRPTSRPGCSAASTSPSSPRWWSPRRQPDTVDERRHGRGPDGRGRLRGRPAARPGTRQPT